MANGTGCVRTNREVIVALTSYERDCHPSLGCQVIQFHLLQLAICKHLLSQRENYPLLLIRMVSYPKCKLTHQKRSTLSPYVAPKITAFFGLGSGFSPQ